MQKNKTDITLHLKKWITKHPWLKLIALILAILVWFYVKTQTISANL